MFYVTPGGQIMLEMVDYYGGTVLILALAAVEVMAIAWIYGTNQIARDFNFMLNMQLSVYWRFCWGVLCPILLHLLFLYVLFTQAGVPNIPYPAQIAGWIISLIGQSKKTRPNGSIDAIRKFQFKNFDSLIKMFRKFVSVQLQNF